MEQIHPKSLDDIDCVERARMRSSRVRPSEIAWAWASAKDATRQDYADVTLHIETPFGKRPSTDPEETFPAFSSVGR